MSRFFEDYDPLEKAKQLFGDDRIEAYLDKDLKITVGQFIFDGRSVFQTSLVFAQWVESLVEDGTLKNLDDKLPHYDDTLKDAIIQMKQFIESSEYTFSFLSRYFHYQWELEWKATHPDDPTDT